MAKGIKGRCGSLTGCRSSDNRCSDRHDATNTLRGSGPVQGIAMRSQPVAELIAERDALRAKVADLEAGAAKRKAKA